MEWVRLFKGEMRALQARILSFAQNYMPSGKRDQQTLETAVRDVTDFCQWADILPEEAEAWQWFASGIGSYNTPDNWKYRLMIIQMNFWGLGHSNPNGNPQVPDLHRQIKAALERIERLLTENFPAEQSVPALISSQNLRPQMIINILWPFFYPELINQHPSTFNVSDWPAVRYHPYWTQKVIDECIASLSRRELAMVALRPIRGSRIVYAQPRRTAEFFEFHLSAQTPLFPAQWETLLENLDSYDGIEPLRELGGSIEPLTWDEGQGQGVIIRLPWVKT